MYENKLSPIDSQIIWMDFDFCITYYTDMAQWTEIEHCTILMNGVV